MQQPKQVIVVRKDLSMRKGKLAAQVAHASLKAVLDYAQRWVEHPGGHVYSVPVSVYGFPIGSPIQDWLDNECFKKVVVSVESEKELDMIFASAEMAKLPRAIIIDNGATEFKGVLTKTCVAVGPDDPQKIDLITGNLPLL